MINKLAAWRKRHTFTLAEAALLITENYPEDWPIDKALAASIPGFLATYRLMLQDAVIVSSHDEISQETGEYFTSYVLNTDKPFHVNKLSLEDGFDIEVQKHILREWLTSKAISSKFFDNDSLTSFEDTSSKEDKILASRERSTLHRVIAALVETNLTNSEFEKQSNLITYLVDHYVGYEGLSKSNLEKLFSEAAKSLK